MLTKEAERSVHDQRTGLPRWLVRCVPGLLFAFLALKVVAPVTDPDAYWHIVAGDHLRQTWHFVLDDPFGASTEKPWVLNQWLPELLMSLAHDIAGLPGVVWLTCLGAVAVLAALWWSARRRASILVSGFVVATALLATSASIAPRPQLVTFALAAVTTDAWLRTAEDRRPRWWLIPMTWIWACSHGMWFLGPLIGGCVVAGMLLSEPPGFRSTLRLAVVPLASFAVAAVTPAGPALLSSPFQVAAVTRYITEWQPPVATSLPFLAALTMVGLVLAQTMRSPRHRQAYRLVLTFVALAFALMYVRTAGVAAAILTPLAADALGALTRQHRESVSRREVVGTASLAMVSLLLAAAVAPTIAARPGLGPNALSPTIDALPKGTIVCNDWTDGGWLIWAHPNMRGTMDSRVELYSTAHIESYRAFLAVEPGWDRYPVENQCTYALLHAGTPTAESLVAQLGWRQVAAAGGYELLAAPTTLIARSAVN